MPIPSEYQKKFKTALLKLDEKYADYLRGIKNKLQEDDINILSFISEVEQNGESNLVFVNKKGLALPNYIRREIVRLHDEIYGT